MSGSLFALEFVKLLQQLNIDFFAMHPAGVDTARTKAPLGYKHR